MDFNKLTEECAEKEMQLTRLQQNEEQIAGELHWYNSLNPQTLEVEQQKHKAKAEQLQREIQTLDQGIQEIRSQLGKIAPKIVTKLNLFKWLTKEQASLRHLKAELSDGMNQKMSQQQSKLSDLEATRTRIRSVAKELEQHRTFPLSDKQAELSRLTQSIADNTADLTLLTERNLRIYDAIAPLLEKMKKIELEQSDLQSRLELAKDFDWRLSETTDDDRYERKMIHRECECQLEESRPQKIIEESSKKINQLQGKHDKIRRRVEEVIEKSVRRIDKVVIDGNNLCYEDKHFIGLVAIEAILPLLSRKYEVVIVFDPEIRSLLNTDDSGLQKRLTNFAKVHVVASGRKADETVLDLASTNEFIYVLSNDKFDDFNDKSAVKEGRLIKHEIVDGHIFVQDLELREAYR